jgi:GntP family gluconate:H+ symporter
VATGIPLAGILIAIQTGFGDLMSYIGLIVVLGSILGVALEQSGAALRLADGVLALAGQKRPILAMSIIGTVIGIPVFCDSGFIILSGLKNAVAKKSEATRGALALALASGLYTAHTLIPPTPGPIAAAGNLGAADHIGLIMLLGFFITIPTVAVAYGWAKLRGENIATTLPDLEPTTDSEHPALWRAIIPIGIPILLIALASVARLLPLENKPISVLYFIGQPVIALLIGVGLAFALFPKKKQIDWVESGIKLAGPILIITGAGGALGGILKATSLADDIKTLLDNSADSGLIILLLAFVIAALLKTMQGSSTSALVITSSILAPLLPALGFDSGIELALAVLAIGAGAMTVSHANDSYFWVVSQFSGISMRDAYRNYTTMTGLQGVAAILTILLLYGLFG